MPSPEIATTIDEAWAKLRELAHKREQLISAHGMLMHANMRAQFEAERMRESQGMGIDAPVVRDNLDVRFQRAVRARRDLA
jgi:hypothetical protein